MTVLERLEKRGIMMSLMNIFKNKLSKFLYKFKKNLKRQAKIGNLDMIFSPISESGSFIDSPIVRKRPKTPRVILRTLYDNF